MVREEASQGGSSKDGGSDGGSSLGAGGSGGGSASPHLWHRGSALDSFGGSASPHLWHRGSALDSFDAFMATTAGVPDGGMGSWGGIPGGPGARATSFNAVVPMTYNGVAPPPFTAVMAPAYGVAATAIASICGVSLIL
jgi:hypothetical protein